MALFTQVRMLAKRLFFLLLLSCFLPPLCAENRFEKVVSLDEIIQELDSLNKLVPSLNSIERRLQYDLYGTQVDSLWGDVNEMTLEQKVRTYRALVSTLVLLDPSQPAASYRPYMRHLKSLSALLPEAYLPLKLRANLIMSHIHLLTLKQHYAYPLLEDIVQKVKKNAGVNSLTELRKDNPYLAMLYCVLVRELFCYQVIKDSVIQRNRTFIDSPIGQYSKTLGNNCSISDKTKTIAYGMLDGDYHKVIDLCDTLVRNQKLRCNDILFLLKIQIDAVNNLPESPAMTGELLRAITVQDSVLAYKETVYNIDYNTYNQLNQQEKNLSDLRQAKERLWTKHMILACVIVILAGAVVLYLLVGYRKRSRMNLAFLKEVQKSAEARKKALSQAEEACEQQLNLMRNFNHDLRVPMNALVGFSNMLGDDEIPEREKQEAAEIVHHTSQQLLDMVNNILDIARLSTNHMVVDYQDVPVNQILDNNLWKAFSEDILPHILTVTSYEQDTIVHTDSKHIVRIIKLLVKNAVQTSDLGEIHLYAQTDAKLEKLIIDVVSSSSHQDRTIVLNCLDRNNQIADYADTNEYYLVLARMLCDLLNCELTLQNISEVGVHMQLLIPLKSAKHDN